MTYELINYQGEVLSETVVDNDVQLRVRKVSGTERSARN